MRNILICKNLSMRYLHSSQSVIQNVNFTLKEGEILTVLGANGSGKSTLLKGILGLMPPEAGSIQFPQKDTKIGYLSQESPHGNDFPATVEEIILTGFLTFKKGFFYSKKDKANANEVMDTLKISEYSKKRFSTLSGGTKQKVLLARAVCSLVFHSKKDKDISRLLLLDEPVNGLDATSRTDLYALIYNLKILGIGIFMISHDSENTLSLSDKILCLHENTHFFGSVKEYKTHSEI